MTSYTSLEKLGTPRPDRFWYQLSIQTFSLLIAATTVALFPAFSYRPWSLPTTYDLKKTRQEINFVVIGVALLFSWLFSHCLSLANNAEALAEFESREMSAAD